MPIGIGFGLSPSITPSKGVGVKNLIAPFSDALWVDASTPPSVTIASGSGILWQTNGSAVGRRRVSFDTVIGETYKITAEGTAISGPNKINVGVGTSNGLINIGNVPMENGFIFVARSVKTWLNFASATNGLTLTKISAVNIKHLNLLQINGPYQDLSIYNRAEGSPLLDTDGVLFNFKWRDIETSEGTYNWAVVDAALAYAKARGKFLIPRLYLKSYTDANDPPTEPTMPSYVMADPTTYGGSGTNGGIAKQYLNAPFGTYTWIGWSPIISNAALRTRLSALLTAMASRYASDPFIQAFMADELIPNIYTGGAYPFSITRQGLIDGLKAYVDAAKAAFTPKPVHVCVNYFDEPNGNATAVELAQYVIDNGMQLALTDVFYPGHPQQGAQPTYAQFVAQSGSGKKGIAVIDYSDYVSEDSGLHGRCDLMAAYSRDELRAKFTAWHAREIRPLVANSNYAFWNAAKASINRYPTR